MTASSLGFRETGTALVFSLMILLIMTIIGVATMSSTQMQERMAGNVNVQSIAFEAASAGVSEALDYGMDRWDAIGCDRDTGGWRAEDEGAISDPVTLNLMDDAAQNLTIQYQLRVDCLEDPGFGPDPDDPTFVPPVQLYVTSQGIVSSDNGELATRDIEVRIDDFRTDGLSAIRAEGEADITFGTPRSNRFSVDGVGGPAISTTTLSNAQEIANAIDDAGRLGNYDGGVVRSDYDPPFNSAWKLARFALEIRAFMEYHGYVGAHQPAVADAPGEVGCNNVDLTSPDLIAEFGSPYLTNMALIDGNFSIGGSTDFDGITYVTGDLSMNGTPRGNGMVIVQGNVEWSGKADFQGLILALGGTFIVDGGGSGETDGMVFTADIDLAAMQPVYEALRNAWVANSWTWEQVLAAMDDWGNPDETDLESTEYRVLDDAASHPDGFGPITIDLSGGGNHTVTYDCSKFDDQRLVLSECGEVPVGGGEEASGLDASEPKRSDFDYDGLADAWANQLCGTPGRGGSLQAIRSWRENLGWRELLEGS